MVISYGQRGTLVKQLKDGRWEAQVGLIKMTLEEKGFNLIKAEKEAAQPKKRQVNVVKRSNTSGPRVRLDLRGKRYEEAMQELDGFIDQALLNNMAQVDIIHGIGTGVIREGVTKYLRRNKHVKSFEYAPKMRVEVAQPLSRLKANRILAVYQLGFLKSDIMKMIESC